MNQSLIQAAKAEGVPIRGAILSKARFPLGRLVVTSGVVYVCESQGIFWHQTVMKFLMFYQNGIWGDVDKESWDMNNRAAVSKTGRILAVYKIGGEKVWVITDFAGEDTYTTFLLPDEY